MRQPRYLEHVSKDKLEFKKANPDMADDNHVILIDTNVKNVTFKRLFFDCSCSGSKPQVLVGSSGFWWVLDAEPDNWF